MRAIEFIVEYNAKNSGKPKPLRTSTDDALPGVYVQRQLRNTNPYMQYRYGLATAAARAVANGDVTFSQESSWAENLVQVMYAPEDEETIRLASKMMGITPTRIANNDSKESEFTYTVSPIANWMNTPQVSKKGK